MKLVETLIEKHIKIINWIGVIASAWILSMIVSELIGNLLPTHTPSTQVRASENPLDFYADNRQKDIAYYMPICERNIFDSQNRSSCAKTAPTTFEYVDDTPRFDPNAAPVKSSINAKLMGTTVFSDPKRSFATIAEGGKTETENYKVDDQILGKAKIYQVERNRVFFHHNGRKEYLEIDGPSIFADGGSAPDRSAPARPSAGVKVDGNNITVTRAKVDSTLSNMNQVLQDARMVPNYTDGMVDGFKVFGIRGGSIFQELGLKNGDVINQINGTTVDGIEKALPMLQLLKTQSNFDIGITRQGKKQDLKITVQ